MTIKPTTLALILSLLRSVDSAFPLKDSEGKEIKANGCTADEVDTESRRGSPWCRVRVVKFAGHGSNYVCNYTNAFDVDVKTTECKSLNGKFGRFECMWDGATKPSMRYYGYNVYDDLTSCESGSIGSRNNDIAYLVLDDERFVDPFPVTSSPSDTRSIGCAPISQNDAAAVDCSRALPAPDCIFSESELMENSCSKTISAGQSCIPRCKAGYRVKGKFTCGYGEPKNNKYEGVFTETATCIKNKCICPNGRVTDVCTDEGAHQCKKDSCNSGYHSAKNGAAYICETCDAEEYYKTSSKTCLPKTCNCDNGIPVEPVACKMHDKQQCKNCTAGYQLSTTDICVQVALNPQNNSAYGMQSPHALVVMVSTLAMIFFYL